jgi:ferredoxin-NADP reductase
MTTHDTKSAHWASRLFKQAGAAQTPAQHKIYYVHRYPDDHALPEQNRFSALFADTGMCYTSTSPVNTEFQRPAAQQPSLTQDRSELAGFADTGNKPAPQTPHLIKLSNSPVHNAQYTVLNSFNETPDTKTFRLGSVAGPVFDYVPGQYIVLSLTIQGREYKRSYSLASSPARADSIEITVKRDPKGGIVSNWLNDTLAAGDTLNVKGPFGKFSCVNDSCQKILFVAAGSGIVPVMSMLRWLTDTNAHVDVQLLLSFRTPDDIIYRDELQLIAARHKNIKLSITLTTDIIARYQWSGLSGRINTKMIAQRVPDLTARAVYLCGPDAFMSTCKESLLKLNCPFDKLYSESFTVNGPIATAENSDLAIPSRSKTGNYRVRFAKSGKTISTDGRMTLLEIAAQSGILIDHECRSGQCGECMIKCLKGTIDMADQAEIDAVNKSKGWIYACCAYPASNLVLDI